MQVYELGYLVLPSIAEDALSGVISKLKQAIAAIGGVEIAGEDPFRIDLAYTMTKVVGASRYVVSDAYLGWIKFEAEAGKVEELKKKVAQMDEIIRSLLIKAPRETYFTFADARAKMLEKEARGAQGEAGEAKEETVVE